MAVFGYRENDISKYLENIVFLELLRRGYQISIGKLGDKEIDFIAEKQNQKLYIQVTYLLASQETFDREFSPLQQIKDAHPKLVLSMDSPAYGSNFHGIQRFKLIHWLLQSQ